MASHTVPAAVPPPPSEPPNASAGTTAEAPGPSPLGSLFAAVDPARATEDTSAGFQLTPTTGQDTDILPDLEAPAGTSSASFHDDNDPANSDTGSGKTSKQETRVMRAWLLAGAERWRKGADARNKALDIKKAKAQARQIKTVETVNRSEKFVGGSTNTGTKTDSGKSLSSKNSGNGSSRGGKNTSGGGNSGAGKGPGSGATGQRNGPSGASGGGGRGPAGANHTRTGVGGATPKQNGGTSKDDKGTKTSKKDSGNNPPGGSKTPAGSGNASGGGAGKPGPKGPSGNAGKDAPAKQGGTGSDGSRRSPEKVHSPGSQSGRPWKDKPTTSDTKPSPKGTDGPADLKKKPKNGPDPSGKDALTSPTSKNKPNADPAGKDTLGKTDKPNPPNKPAPGSGGGKPRINTKDSREAGYRDGTRIARVEAHVHAYRDGVRDGRTDIKEAAAEDKARLDKAHADRKKQRTQAPVPPKPVYPPKPTQPPAPPASKDEPVTKTDTSAPTNPSPIQVTSTTPTHINLGTGADRPSISRGEVRNLAGHQKRLADRAETLARIAERARAYEAHAVNQTKKVTQLLEQAKGKEGGEKLVAELSRLEESAKAQEGKAREVVKRAARAIDACQAVSANVEVRYGDIYRAAADSPDGPAELNYYRDLGYAHA